MEYLKSTIVFFFIATLPFMFIGVNQIHAMEEAELGVDGSSKVKIHIKAKGSRNPNINVDGTFQLEADAFAEDNEHDKGKNTGPFPKIIGLNGSKEENIAKITGVRGTYSRAKARMETSPLVIDDVFNPGQLIVVGGIARSLVGVGVTLGNENNVHGSGKAVVKDPFNFEHFSNEDEELIITSSLEAGTSFRAGYESSGAMRILKATTTIPGLETLYKLKIKVLGTISTPNLMISFLSNPILGLSDSEVENKLKEKFIFSGNGSFVLDSDVIIYDGILPLPENIEKFSVGFDDEAQASDNADELLLTLASFKSISNQNNIRLSWVTKTEKDNAGSRLWRSTENGNGDYINITLLREFGHPEQVNPEPNESCSTKIQGQLNADNSNQPPKLISAIGNSAESTCYSFTDTSDLSDGTYYYLLEDIGDDGKNTFHCDYIDAVTVGQGPAIDLQSAMNYCKEVTGSKN